MQGAGRAALGPLDSPIIIVPSSIMFDSPVSGSCSFYQTENGMQAERLPGVALGAKRGAWRCWGPGPCGPQVTDLEGAAL